MTNDILNKLMELHEATEDVVTFAHDSDVSIQLYNKLNQLNQCVVDAIVLTNTMTILSEMGGD